MTIPGNVTTDPKPQAPSNMTSKNKDSVDNDVQLSHFLPDNLPP